MRKSKLLLATLASAMVITATLQTNLISAIADVQIMETEHNATDQTAVDSGTCGKNLTWVFDSSGTLTISGDGDMCVSNFVTWRVPWRQYNSEIKRVVLENGVTSIGESAFYNCRGLTSIEIPSSVKSIGESAFYNCSGLTSIEIPSSVKSIGESAFYNCSGLTSIEIPSSVTSIGNHVFSGCSTLASVKIPSSVKSIGDGMFSGCSGLTSIEIPYNVTSIGEGAFSCSGLTSIEIPSSVRSIGEMAFFCCSRLTDIKIPSGVTSIGYRAFDGCIRLTSIEIPSGMTSIGDHAFTGLSGLTSIKIPYGVTSIGDSAFNGCSGLTSIKIPFSVTSLGDYAFCNCRGLTSIEIPSSVTSIGHSAFMWCDDLVIYGTAGSYAQKYAEEQSIDFIEKKHIHCYETVITKASTYKRTNGSIVKKCTDCGFVGESNIIYYTDKINLSSTSISYDGKAKKPSITVKDSAGKVIPASNYTVKYTNNINVGKATVKVIMKGNYTGTFTKKFTIKQAVNKITGTSTYNKIASSTKAQSFTLNAKAIGGKLKYKSSSMSVTVNSEGKVTIAKNFVGKVTIKVTAGNSNYKVVTKTVTINVKPAATKLTGVTNSSSKKATVKWSKIPLVSGYQIQYGTNNGFKGAKIITVSSASSVSKVLTNLTKGKNYYVRVRGYKTVGSTKFYGAWSAKKSVKIRK